MVPTAEATDVVECLQTVAPADVIGVLARSESNSPITDVETMRYVLVGRCVSTTFDTDMLDRNTNECERPPRIAIHPGTVLEVADEITDRTDRTHMHLVTTDAPLPGVVLRDGTPQLLLPEARAGADGFNYASLPMGTVVVCKVGPDVTPEMVIESSDWDNNV